MFSGSQVQEEIQKSRLLLAKTQRLRQSSAVFRTYLQSSQFKTSYFRSAAQNQCKAADRRIQELEYHAAEYYITKYDASRCNDRLLLADALSALKMARYRALYDLGAALAAYAPQQRDDGEARLMQEQRYVLLHRAYELYNRLYDAIDRLKSATNAEELVDSHCELVRVQFQRQIGESVQEDPWTQPRQQILEAFYQANLLPMSSEGLAAACLGNFDEARELFDTVFAEVADQLQSDAIMQMIARFLNANKKAAVCAAYAECAERCGNADYQALEGDILRYINANLRLSIDQNLLREYLLLMQLGGAAADDRTRDLLTQMPLEAYFDVKRFSTYLLAYEAVTSSGEYLAGRTARENAELYSEYAEKLLVQLRARCAGEDYCENGGYESLKGRFKDYTAAFYDYIAIGYISGENRLKLDILRHISDIAAQLSALNLFCVQRTNFYRICAYNQRLYMPDSCFPVSLTAQHEKIPLQREIDARERIRHTEEAKEYEFRAATRDLLQTVGELVKVEDALGATTIPDETLIEYFTDKDKLGRHTYEFRVVISKDEDLYSLAQNLRVASSKSIEVEMSDFGRFRTACAEQFKAEVAYKADELHIFVADGLREVYERPELYESEILRLGEVCQLANR